MGRRRALAPSLRQELLREAGYRCANPACRSIITHEIHHLDPVKADGGNTEGNLLALCPNCHALHHGGHIREEALRTWKLTLVAINQQGLRNIADRLLFLAGNKSGLPPGEVLQLSADGLLHFSDLIVGGLVQARFHESSSGGGGFPPYQLFSVRLTEKGQLVVDAWKAGRLDDLKAALTMSF